MDKKVFAHMHKGSTRTPCSEAWWEVMESGKLLNKRMRSPHGKLGSSVRTRQKCVHWLQRCPSQDAGGRACCINTTRPEVHLHVCSPPMTIVLLAPSVCISELVLLPSKFSLCLPTRNTYGSCHREAALQPYLRFHGAQFGTYNKIVTNCLI